MDKARTTATSNLRVSILGTWDQHCGSVHVTVPLDRGGGVPGFPPVGKKPLEAAWALGAWGRLPGKKTFRRRALAFEVQRLVTAPRGSFQVGNFVHGCIQEFPQLGIARIRAISDA